MKAMQMTARGYKNHLRSQSSVVQPPAAYQPFRPPEQRLLHPIWSVNKDKIDYYITCFMHFSLIMCQCRNKFVHFDSALQKKKKRVKRVINVMRI